MSLAAAMLEASTFAQNVNAEVRPLSVVVAGEALPAAGRIGPVARIRRAEGGGFIKVRELACSIAKTLLPVAPAPGSAILCGGHSYTVQQVGGENPTDAAWKIKAQHFPS